MIVDQTARPALQLDDAASADRALRMSAYPVRRDLLVGDGAVAVVNVHEDVLERDAVNRPAGAKG